MFYSNKFFADVFRDNYHWLDTNTKEPHSWWLTFRDNPDINDLAMYASQLFQIPASSAAVERSFSKQARIQTRARNRLSEDKVEKIMKIQFNSNYETCKVFRRDINVVEEEAYAISQTTIQPISDYDELLSEDEDD